MSMPPAGPPPGYQGPQGPQGMQNHGEPTVAISRPDLPYDRQPSTGAPDGPQVRRTADRPQGSGTILVLGIIAVVAVVLGLSLTENGRTAWDWVNAWGGVAIVGALATLAPALGRSVGLSAQRAWQVAVCGAGALVLFWVLFVLPVVGSNTSLLMTVGVAAGLIAAWIAPGRDQKPDDRGHSW